jgi:hypothetical protein
MKKYSEDLVCTGDSKADNINSRIMELADDLATKDALVEYGELREGFYVTVEREKTMCEEAQEIWQRCYEEYIDVLYTFANRVIEIDREEEESGERVTEAMIDRALNYVSMERDETERILKEIDLDPTISDGDMIDFCHEDFDIAYAFENVFTVGDFFDQIRKE